MKNEFLDIVLGIEKDNGMTDRENADKLKSTWKPKTHNVYYTPCYVLNMWDVGHNVCLGTKYERAGDKGEAFKTESDCRRYMNAKGWINEELWKI